MTSSLPLMGRYRTKLRKSGNRPNPKHFPLLLLSKRKMKMMALSSPLLFFKFTFEELYETYHRERKKESECECECEREKGKRENVCEKKKEKEKRAFLINISHISSDLR